MLTDILILKRIREGDIKTFESVFKQYYSSLYLYAFSITGERPVSEEIVQELFYVLWRDRESIQILHSIKSYLYKSVRNSSYQHLEHLSVREKHRESIVNKINKQNSTNPLEELENRELEDIINRTLREMPQRRSRIFRMHRFEGKKYKEIAEYFSLSVKTVEAEMTKVYQVLRKEIEKYTHIL